MAGGWYHVFNRGHNGESLFQGKRDYEHFVELVEVMHEQYRVRVYAYALMGNHFHLLVGTPEGNLSAGMHWLEDSYAIWRNRKYDRSGHVYEGRYKAILVEGQEWGLELSVYLHLNCVVTVEMGLGKRRRRMEQKGWARPPSKEEVERRLGKIREYPWSSYRAYGGYGATPNWLNTRVLLGRRAEEGEDRETAYRELVESRLKQETEETPWQKVRWGLVLGSERFARKVRGKIRVGRDIVGQGELRHRRSLEELKGMVERLKGEKWEQFRDRYGDWGRELLFWAGRRYGGYTLTELGNFAGGADYTAVSNAITRLEDKATTDKTLRRAMNRIRWECQK